MQIFWLIIIFILCFCIYIIKNIEIANFITAFLVIDISNTERENLAAKEKVYFYNSISTISRALVCGFTAPFFYIAVLGNIFAIVYMFVCNLYFTDKDYDFFKFVFIIFTIIPSLIIELILYIIFIIKNNNRKPDFKGDFIANSLIRPLLNVDIMAAYIESINFYFHYNINNMEYLKSYGDYSKKIDEICIKDYLGIAYTVSIFIFCLFFILEKFILKNF